MSVKSNNLLDRVGVITGNTEAGVYVRECACVRVSVCV